jgi:quinoprotein glucose dehydrogenase
MTRRPRLASLALGIATLTAGPLIPPHTRAGEPDRPEIPKVEPASDEGARAIARFKVPAGLKVELFAAEPLLANPVAFCVDEQGRFYVAETFRHGHGVTDTRNHMNWLDDDLAARTVADRVAMYRKYLGPQEFARFGEATERVRLIEDRDGDGKADRATIFADGFRDPAAGIGAGVLARRGDVYYTCIPDLWRLRDRDGDGKADVRESLRHGFGVHVGFLGHDLHGLRMGPDGRLYFTIGDRGTNIDGSVFLPDTGAVLRCNPDGTGLEVFATGLRNPQELAFDEFGNLFTVDNNSDGGDRARLVYLVEGGDSGWRIGYQFIESPNSRGPWNAEKLWHPAPDNTAAYLLPPLANVSDGPSGLTYDPGATLLPDEFRRHFFLADFRGSGGTSGVRSFAVKPKGASFEMVDSRRFLWGLEATDVDFGADGALYVADWVEGWGTTGKGRLYKVFDPSRRDDLAVREVKRLLAEGMKGRPLDELAKLLEHRDNRVRQEAQFELAERGLAEAKTWSEAPGAGGKPAGTSVHAVLAKVAKGGSPTLARLHALWALGQIARRYALVEGTLATLLQDPDAEVRAQVARLFGEIPRRPGTRGTTLLVPLLRDESPRVRSFAALALAKVGDRDVIGPICDLLRDADDRDPYLRHAGVMALAGTRDVAALLQGRESPSPAVRLGVLLALRRLGSTEVARFLDDPDPRLVLEAARAINDVPIEGALPKLAALEPKSAAPEPLLRRVLNANFRLRWPEHARALAAMAARRDLPGAIRIEALEALGDWAEPPGRDRVMGLWRPIIGRSKGPAAEAAEPVVARLLRDAPEALRRAAARTANRLAIKSAAPVLAEVAADAGLFAATRVEALKALDGLDEARLADSVRRSVADPEPRLRTEGLRLLARLDPAAAIGPLQDVLERGTTAERQGAIATLGGMKADAADAALARWLDRLQAGQVPPEVRLDLLEAAARRPSAEVKQKLARFEAMRPKGDPLAPYREALAGGDAARGRKVFREKAEVQCLRCHKIDGDGGEVGPELTGIGKRQSRDAILESIVLPNKQIAQGFESVVVATDDGQVHAGVLKGEDDATLRLMTPEGKAVAIPKATIEERKRGASAMPEDTITHLSRSELRDLVEFLARSK